MTQLRKGTIMKTIHCDKVDPGAGCDYVVRGKTDEEVLKKAKEHVRKDHGVEPTAEMIEEVRTYIEEE
jgi:predicted small metal-binding protein